MSTGGKLAQLATYYDPATRRVNETVTARETAPSTVADTQYTYDPSGNITKIAESSNGDSQCFTNDYLGRLVQAWTPAGGDCAQQPTAASLGGPAPYWQSWTLDAVGGWLTRTDHATASGDAVTTYTYPGTGANQAHTLSGTSVTDSAGTRAATYAYDPAGATISRPGPHGQQTLTWDVEGHLASLTDSAGASSYLYTADGDRFITRDPSGVTMDLGPVELRLSASSNTVTATHFYAMGGRLVGQRTAAGVTWLATDLHGTDQIAIDAASQAVTRRWFTPYGERRGPAVAWVSDKGYLRGTAEASGLTLLGAREYDPATGRFVSVDPVLAPGDPTQTNGYSYAGDSPVTSADPSGLMKTDRAETGPTTPPPPASDPYDFHPRDWPKPGAGRHRNGYAIVINGQSWVILANDCNVESGHFVQGPCAAGGRARISVLGPQHQCTNMADADGLCYVGPDGYVYDVDGRRSCLPADVTGPCQPSATPVQAPAPVATGRRTAAGPPPPVHVVNPAPAAAGIDPCNGGGIWCFVGDGLAYGAFFLGLAGPFCPICDAIATGMSLGSAVSYGFAGDGNRLVQQLTATGVSLVAGSIAARPFTRIAGGLAAYSGGTARAAQFVARGGASISASAAATAAGAGFCGWTPSGCDHDPDITNMPNSASQMVLFQPGTYNLKPFTDTVKGTLRAWVA
jgi:RHS repeat-associated protein